MTASPPAYCPRCKSIFPVSLIKIGDGARATLSNVGTNCPICGFEDALISDGVYTATQDAITLISGPESTRQILEILGSLAERVSAGKINREQASEETRSLPPTYAALFNTFATFGLPALALLASLIQVYLQYDSNKSSGEDAKKLLEAVTEQTFTLKQIQKQNVQNAGSDVSAKKAEVKTAPVKDPPRRRTQVNKQRRESLKKYREAFGQSRAR